jgi:hypothetical protein
VCNYTVGAANVKYDLGYVCTHAEPFQKIELYDDADGTDVWRHVAPKNVYREKPPFCVDRVVLLVVVPTKPVLLLVVLTPSDVEKLVLLLVVLTPSDVE